MIQIRAVLVLALALGFSGFAAAQTNDALKSRLATLAAGTSVRLAGDELEAGSAVQKVYQATGYRLLWQDEGKFRALIDTIRSATDFLPLRMTVLIRRATTGLPYLLSKDSIL